VLGAMLAASYGLPGALVRMTATTSEAGHLVAAKLLLHDSTRQLIWLS